MCTFVICKYSYNILLLCVIGNTNYDINYFRIHVMNYKKPFNIIAFNNR